MDWQNLIGYTTKSILHVQPHSHQNSNDTDHRGWKMYHKIHLETQKTMNSQGNTEQKEQRWRYHNTWLQSILQSHSNQNSMVLAKKHIWRAVEQIWIHTAVLTLFLTKAPKTYDGEKTASSTNVAGKSRYLPAENGNKIHAYHPVLVSTQSGLRILISDPKPCS
jgi:hypothetical protein